MRFRPAVAVVVLLAATAVAEDAGVVAVIKVQTELRMDPKVRKALKPAELARITQSMVTLGWKELEPGLLIDEPRPLAGRWIEIGKQRYPIDNDGLVHLPPQPGELRNVKLYNDVGDLKHWLIIPKLEVVPAGATPPVTLVKLKGHLPPGEMN